MTKRNKRWFKARPYGWGWYPCLRQRFVVLAVWGFWVYVLFQVAHPEQHLVWFLLGLYGSILVLTLVCWKTTERSSWRWGGKEPPLHIVLRNSLVVVAVIGGLIGWIIWLFFN